MADIAALQKLVEELNSALKNLQGAFDTGDSAKQMEAMLNNTKDMATIYRVLNTLSEQQNETLVKGNKALTSAYQGARKIVETNKANVSAQLHQLGLAVGISSEKQQQLAAAKDIWRWTDKSNDPELKALTRSQRVAHYTQFTSKNLGEAVSRVGKMAASLGSAESAAAGLSGGAAQLATMGVSRAVGAMAGGGAAAVGGVAFGMATVAVAAGATILAAQLKMLSVKLEGARVAFGNTADIAAASSQMKEFGATIGKAAALHKVSAEEVGGAFRTVMSKMPTDWDKFSKSTGIASDSLAGIRGFAAAFGVGMEDTAGVLTTLRSTYRRNQTSMRKEDQATSDLYKVYAQSTRFVKAEIASRSASLSAIKGAFEATSHYNQTMEDVGRGIEMFYNNTYAVKPATVAAAAQRYQNLTEATANVSMGAKMLSMPSAGIGAMYRWTQMKPNERQEALQSVMGSAFMFNAQDNDITKSIKMQNAGAMSGISDPTALVDLLGQKSGDTAKISAQETAQATSDVAESSEKQKEAYKLAGSAVLEIRSTLAQMWTWMSNL